MDGTVDFHSTIIQLDEIDSTNSYAIECFDELSSPALIVADTQTAGRGRRGRSWVSPSGENFYGSYLVKDFSLPLVAASWIGSLATLDTLRELAPGVDFWLKWPNDIYVDSAKISGLLCEVKTDAANQVQGIVIGIGVNLNMPESVLRTIDQPATSLLKETGNELTVKKFTDLLARNLDGIYSTSFSGETSTLFRCWKAENRLLGQMVDIVRESGPRQTGKAVDVSPEGELVVVIGDDVVHLRSGDVSVRKT